MTAIARGRRLACCVVALALSVVVLHRQLADALVTRGDDAARAGDRGAALRAYGRAVALDPSSTVAADRLAFALTLRHRPREAARAVDVANVALARTSDPALLADRAFAELALRRWSAAQSDFAEAARRGHDARYAHFAARIALRRGDRTAARAYARTALAIDQRFPPARALLASLR